MARACLLLMASIFVASPAFAASAPKDSWGKAGVSLAQYRQDALDCGKQGYYSDISKTADAKAFVTASRQLDNVSTAASAPTVTEMNATGPDTSNGVDQMVETANQKQHIVESVHAEERFHSIKKTLEEVVAQCLTARGYSKFRLTDEQRKQMSHLGAGTDARRQYLYSLASNPAVLKSQAEPSQP